jgi:dihydrofolate reductase
MPTPVLSQFIFPNNKNIDEFAPHPRSIELKGEQYMRKIIALNHVTLDGVIQSGGGPQEDPSGGFTQGGWSVPFRSEDSGKAVLEITSREFDLLFGRRTYEIWAAFWPHANHPVAIAINKAAKYVVTKSLGSLDWANSHKLGGDVVEEIRRLKASDGPELHIWGSSQLLQTLIAAELVDEFHIWIYPVVVGKGKRLFEEGLPAFGLTLVESRPTSKGILLNTYRPAGPLPDVSVQPDNPSDAEIARRRKLAAEDVA